MLVGGLGVDCAATPHCVVACLVLYGLVFHSIVPYCRFAVGYSTVTVTLAVALSVTLTPYSLLLLPTPYSLLRTPYSILLLVLQLLL